MNRRRRAVATMAVALIVLAGCGSDGDKATTTTTAATGGPTSAASNDSSPGTTAGTASSAPVARGGTFRWGTTTIPSSFDPAQVGSDANVVYMTYVYDNLIRADASGELVPGLATAWTLSDDARVLDLTLRDGVEFQDGTPFDAAAVVANFDHLRADGSLLASPLSLIDAVEAVDASHVRFTLNRDGGDLPELLRGYAGMMVSPASLAAGTAGQQPVGAGPFKVTAISDTKVTYERWDGYWDAGSIALDGAEVYFMADDAARLNALRSGQLDGTFIRPNQVAEAESAGLATTTGPRVFLYGLYLNAEDPALASPDVRKALSLAIDRESIDEFLYDGGCRPTAQLYPSEYWAYSNDIDDDQYARHDPDAARQLLASAAPDGLSLTILTPAITNYQRLSEVLQEQLGEAGIKVEIESADPTDVSTRVRQRQYQASVSAFYSANPDPSTFALTYFALGNDQFVSPQVPTLVAQSRQTTDRDERAAAIGELSAAVLDAGTPMVAVCIPEIVFAFPKTVHGLAVPLLGNYDFRGVSIDS